VCVGVGGRQSRPANPPPRRSRRSGARVSEGRRLAGPLQIRRAMP
jgi:hypothetical protein